MNLNLSIITYLFCYRGTSQDFKIRLLIEVRVLILTYMLIYSCLSAVNPRSENEALQTELLITNEMK